MRMVFDVADVARFAWRQPRRWVVCLALALAVTAGCGKSSSPAESAAPPVSLDSTNAQQNPSPMPPSPQPVIAANPDDSQKTLQGLNRVLIGWMIRNHRHPKTFEEFAGSANVQIPDPPAGEKYALDSRGFIVLVSN